MRKGKSENISPQLVSRQRLKQSGKNYQLFPFLQKNMLVNFIYLKRTAYFLSFLRFILFMGMLISSVKSHIQSYQFYPKMRKVLGQFGCHFKSQIYVFLLIILSKGIFLSYCEKKLSIYRSSNAIIVFSIFSYVLVYVILNAKIFLLFGACFIYIDMMSTPLFFYFLCGMIYDEKYVAFLITSQDYPTSSARAFKQQQIHSPYKIAFKYTKYFMNLFFQMMQPFDEPSIFNLLYCFCWLSLSDIRSSICPTIINPILIIREQWFIYNAHQQIFLLTMTTYAQTTIHSKIAKYEKISGDGSLGRVVKGTLSQFGPKTNEKNQPTPDIMKQIQILPKNKLNVARKLKNAKIIPGTNKNDEIVLMESSIFPAIYFKKTTMRNVLKQFTFPPNCRALPPNDERTPLIYQIISNLFSEITFYIFNILIGQNLVTQSYYVFFSDSQTIPFTKCCNAPVFIELLENGSGKILCNSVNCTHSNLAEFLINFEDGRKLWKNITYFADAHEKDKELKKKIARLIHNGKYKKMNLVNIVQDTSQQIVDLFYLSKKDTERQKQKDDEQDINPFVTGHQGNLQPTNNFQPEVTTEDILSPEEKNIDTLKMKLMYMTKRQKDINKQVSKDIVENSKVFNKNFQMIKKIDEFMLKNKNSKTSTKISFPKIMDQVNKQNRKTHSKSMYNSFN